MKAYKVRKFNGEKNKEYFTTVLARDPEAAKEQARDEMREPDGYVFEIISEKSVAPPKSRLEKFVDRYGYKPAYGDYEATGWMEE